MRRQYVWVTVAISYLNCSFAQNWTNHFWNCPFIVLYICTIWIYLLSHACPSGTTMNTYSAADLIKQKDLMDINRFWIIWFRQFHTIDLSVCFTWSLHRSMQNSAINLCTKDFCPTNNVQSVLYLILWSP